MDCQVCGGQHSDVQACVVARAPESAPGRAPPPPVKAPKEDPLIGSVLGSFRLVRKLGKGGMGTVYLGEQRLIGSKVAVKVLHPDLATDPQAVARFQSEARAVNLIGHENIVSIFDMGTAGETHYFVMEYLEGEPLTSLLQGPLEPEVAIPILTQVCDALAAAHERSVVHRDLKPDNIFLIQRGKSDRFVKVLDFGVAKLLTADLQQTMAGMCVGTPTYMAPEQWQGQTIDGRADIYALGVLTYRLATGQLPFPRGGMLEMMNYHREKTPPPPHHVHPRVPVTWSSAIMKAIDKRPEDRFQTAAQFAAALKDVLNHLDARPATHTPTMRPAAMEPPAPEGAQGRAPWKGRVFGAAGEELFLADCTDLSRGGMFVSHEGQLPALFARLKVRLELPDEPLECPCEVVRHVTAREAASWKMKPGFGVQFVDTTPEFKARLTAVIDAATRKPATPSEVLDRYPVEQSDHYRVLQVESGATISEVRRMAERARVEVTALLAVPLPETERRRAHQVLERIAEAERTLGSEATRVEYDARRRNFRGVARCLDAGVAPKDVQTARERYLSAEPNAEDAARVHLLEGQRLELSGDVTEALQAYEQGLRLDPLSMELHEHYWLLYRRLRAAASRGSA